MKPLNQKSYGSIGHLPGSRTGPADKTLPSGQARILTEKLRDKKDLVIVQEKLDGSNVAVLNQNGTLIPINRAGHSCWDAPREMHRIFAHWVYKNLDMFAFLKEGERVCGEWLGTAHSIRYTLPRGPFVVFDLMIEHDRENHETLQARVGGFLPLATTLHVGGPLSIPNALELAEKSNVDGRLDPLEGCVWRCERAGKVDFLGKYVIPGFVSGKYFDGPEILNFRLDS